MRSAGAASWILVLALAAPTHAFHTAPPKQERRSADLWASLAEPALQRARALREQALVHRAEAQRVLPSGWEQVCRRSLALGRGGESHAAVRGRMRALRALARQALRKRAHLDNALARLERAAELAPRDPEVLYEVAYTLAQWEEPGPLWSCTTRRRDGEALAAFERLRALAPMHRPRDVAHVMGNLLTRQLRFRDAADAQLRAIAFALDREALAIDYYNLAELTMLAGELEDAVVYYRSSMATGRSQREHLLPLWGLAVALDRLGEHGEAIAEARRAVAGGGGRMAILRAPDVFFKPDHEIHYYEGLGHEARAEMAEGLRRLQALHAAETSFQQFLAGAGERGAFAADAADNLRSLSERIEAARRELDKDARSTR
ncbi:MAG: hypothetical protein OXT09_27365 [Myxococcales bacterium]|nr:hypothetical protein [Myxococcales bacterium]